MSDIQERRPLTDGVISELLSLTEEYSGKLPVSTDGVKCEVYARHSLVNGDGDTVDAPNDAGDFYFDLVLGFGDEDLEHCFSLHLSLADGSFSVSEYEDELAELKVAVQKFLPSLEGVSHREYLRALASERYCDRYPEPTQSPFDYKRFFIGASVVCATLILMLFVINDILPKLL
ncbi:MAG: hypothetical protein IJF38_06465 [Clostridia bacterium]|nr:hypothetical protein [Clostridia bacterium]